MKITNKELTKKGHWPCLRKAPCGFNGGEIVVLFTSMCKGTVVYSTEPLIAPVGYHSNTWLMGAFEAFEGIIEMEA